MEASGMHPRLFEGRHLVYILSLKIKDFVANFFFFLLNQQIFVHFTMILGRYPVLISTYFLCFWNVAVD